MRSLRNFVHVRPLHRLFLSFLSVTNCCGILIISPNMFCRLMITKSICYSRCSNSKRHLQGFCLLVVGFEGEHSTCGIFFFGIMIIGQRSRELPVNHCNRVYLASEDDGFFLPKVPGLKITCRLQTDCKHEIKK
jgi:hypothetical protein